METMIQTPKGVVHTISFGSTTSCGYTIEGSIPVKAEKPTCKRCLKYMERPSEEPDKKRCSICEEMKPLKEFFYDSAVDRHTTKCRDCMIKYSSDRRKAKRQGKNLSMKEFKQAGMYKRPKEKGGRKKHDELRTG